MTCFGKVISVVVLLSLVLDRDIEFKLCIEDWLCGVKILVD